MPGKLAPMHVGRSGTVATIAAALAVQVAPAIRSDRRLDARVLGTFMMQARVTVAVGIPGESPGDVLARRWVITARDCHRSSCAALVLVRQRSDGLDSTLELRRTGPGRYAGRGSFDVPLLCAGRVYPSGSRAPYRITLRVTGASRIGGIAFARSLSAAYSNPQRSNSTPCPLAPSHDAAVYSGHVISGLPNPPVARFTAHVHRSGAVSFRSRSRPGRGNGRIVRWVWSFGDRGSPYGNTARGHRARHTYRAPGRYRVVLRVTTADGLSATRRRIVIVRAPAPAAAPTTPTPSPAPARLSRARPAAR
jgi:hypothetical protein